MKLELMMRDERREGRAEGETCAIISGIRNLMETLNFTENQAMDALKVPEKEQKKYSELLKSRMPDLEK